MLVVKRFLPIAAILCACTLTTAAVPSLAIAQDLKYPVSLLAPSAPPKPSSAEEGETPNELKASRLHQEVDSPVAYSSLSEAVAAQLIPESIVGELSCLAGAVYFESKGEPLAGQLAVAHVIMNRARSGRFPKSLCSVVTQRGQFSFIRDGRLPEINGSSAYRKAVAVAQLAIDEGWANPVPDALYFHASSVSPGWNRVRVGSIGRHVFYR